MNTVVLVICLVLAALLAPVGLLGRLWTARRVVQPRQRVLVQLTTGRAFSGVLWRRAGGYLVLRDVALLETGSPDPQPLDGEVVVEASVVEWVQALG